MILWKEVMPDYHVGMDSKRNSRKENPHYGELCASVGLNGAVLNNVNANLLSWTKNI